MRVIRQEYSYPFCRRRSAASMREQSRHIPCRPQAAPLHRAYCPAGLTCLHFEHFFSGTGWKAGRAAFRARRSRAASVLHSRPLLESPFFFPLLREKASAGFTSPHSPHLCSSGISISESSRARYLVRRSASRFFWHSVQIDDSPSARAAFRWNWSRPLVSPQAEHCFISSISREYTTLYGENP